MGKISDEEFAEIEREKRHDEIVSALKSIAVRNVEDSDKIAGLLAKSVAALEGLAANSKPDMKPLIAELTKGMKDLKQKPVEIKQPTSFRVERNRVGLIEKIVVIRGDN